MKRKKWPLILFFIILAAGLAGSFLALRPSHSREVEILRDGEVLYRLDLSKEKDRTIQIEYEGRTNTVEIRDHRIRMAEAKCPDHTCVEMGWLNSETPIVCLPNHLLIRFAKHSGEVDSVAG